MAIHQGDKVLYLHNTGTGCWGTPIEGEEKPENPMLTDELRLYSGNTFTISLSNNTYEEAGNTYKYSDTYEITKVKVYIKGGNRINNSILASDTYGRFVDLLLVPTEEGKTAISNLAGMEYSVNSTSNEVWQQWSGDGRNSVTLMLADCDQKASGISWDGLEYTYEYYIPRANPSSYVVVDYIEVKCIKKDAAADQ